MKKSALDTWDELPKDMMMYLRHNGWHFNRQACEYACGLMRDRNGERIKPLTKQQVDEMLQRFGVELQDKNNYDYVYVANMCRADYLGSSIPDENRMAMYVKDTIEDKDAGEGQTFRRWYADMCGKGEMVFWEELL